MEALGGHLTDRLEPCHVYSMDAWIGCIEQQCWELLYSFHSQAPRRENIKLLGANDRLIFHLGH